MQLPSALWQTLLTDILTAMAPIINCSTYNQVIINLASIYMMSFIINTPDYDQLYFDYWVCSYVLLFLPKLCLYYITLTLQVVVFLDPRRSLQVMNNHFMRYCLRNSYSHQDQFFDLRCSNLASLPEVYWTLTKGFHG